MRVCDPSWIPKKFFQSSLPLPKTVEFSSEEQFSLVYLCSDRRFQGIREPYFSAQPPETIQTHLIVCVHGLDGKYHFTLIYRYFCTYFQSIIMYVGY